MQCVNAAWFVANAGISTMSVEVSTPSVLSVTMVTRRLTKMSVGYQKMILKAI